MADMSRLTEEHARRRPSERAVRRRLLATGVSVAWFPCTERRCLSNLLPPGGMGSHWQRRGIAGTPLGRALWRGPKGTVAAESVVSVGGMCTLVALRHITRSHRLRALSPGP